MGSRITLLYLQVQHLFSITKKMGSLMEKISAAPGMKMELFRLTHILPLANAASHLGKELISAYLRNRMQMAPSLEVQIMMVDPVKLQVAYLQIVLLK